MNLAANEAQHGGDGGTTQVDVKQANCLALGHKGERQLGGDGALPHSAFA